MTEREKIPAIIGVGSAYPERVVTNKQLEEILGLKHPGALKRLMDSHGIGVEERRWVIPGKQAASDLAAEALMSAINMAGIDKSALKSIIIGTASEDFRGVATAAIVQDILGLSTDVRTYDVGAGCTGWAQTFKNVMTDITSIYGDGGPQAAMGGDLLSLVLNPREKANYTLFGDGMGATIVDLVTPDSDDFPKPIVKFGTDGKYAENLGMPAGGSIEPITVEGVQNGRAALHMDGMIIAPQAIKRMAEISKRILEEANFPKEEVTLLIPHQANLKIMHEVADLLGVNWEKVIVTIDRYGNTSAATIPASLREAWDKGQINRNDVMMFATFGAGLTWAGGLLPMVGLPRK